MSSNLRSTGSTIDQISKVLDGFGNDTTPEVLRKNMTSLACKIASIKLLRDVVADLYRLDKPGTIEIIDRLSVELKQNFQKSITRIEQADQNRVNALNTSEKALSDGKMDDSSNEGGASSKSGVKVQTVTIDGQDVENITFTPDNGETDLQVSISGENGKTPTDGKTVNDDDETLSEKIVVHSSGENRNGDDDAIIQKIRAMKATKQGRELLALLMEGNSPPLKESPAKDSENEDRTRNDRTKEIPVKNSTWGDGSGYRYIPDEKRQCFTCKRRGHIAANCWHKESSSKGHSTATYASTSRVGRHPGYGAGTSRGEDQSASRGGNAHLKTIKKNKPTKSLTKKGLRKILSAVLAEGYELEDSESEYESDAGDAGHENFQRGKMSRGAT